MLRTRKNALTVQMILKIPGITVGKLMQAIYHLRISQGQCAIQPCHRKPDKGKSQCGYHRRRGLDRAIESKARRKETCQFNRDWDSR